jgi:hypothetical protein
MKRPISLAAKNILAILLMGSIILTSCKKAGLGGNSSVSGTVKHHVKPIPNAVVYIKYGATEFPGADVSKYDASVASDASANYSFKGLEKGDYYLYGFGYDSTLMQNVMGGIGITLKKNQALSSDVPVTE